MNKNLEDSKFNIKFKEPIEEKIEDPVEKDKNEESADKKNAEKKIKLQKRSPMSDLKRYKDLEGLTIGKLEFGLWLAKNRNNFKKILYATLIIISVITWSIFFYHFGLYIFKGMREDQKMLTALAQLNAIRHDISIQQSPLELQTGPIQYTKVGNNKYDIFIHVTNPNPNFWVEISYSFAVNDETIGKAEGFILPKESKYLLLLNQEITDNPEYLRINFDRKTWQRITFRNFPDWNDFAGKRLMIDVNEISFIPANASPLSEKVNLNELSFTTTNKSAYNYYDVDYIIVLKNTMGNIAAVNKYTIDKLFSEDTMSINVTWPGDMGPIRDIEIYPEVNITREEVYIPFSKKDDQ